MDGSLPFDGRLPSSRALAQKINVSRNTVVSAYQQLEVEGYVQAQRGSQTFVAAAPIAIGAWLWLLGRVALALL